MSLSLWTLVIDSWNPSIAQGLGLSFGQFTYSMSAPNSVDGRESTYVKHPVTENEIRAPAAYHKPE